MDRRGFLVGGVALTSLPRLAKAADAAGAVAADDLRTAAREAWLYGVAPSVMAAIRAGAIGDHPLAGTAGYNAFVHSRQPADSRSRGFSAPEPGLLYSSAWINLAAGGARLAVPPTGTGWFRLSLIDMYGDTLKVVGGPQVADEGAELTLMGPPGRIGVGGYVVPKPRMPRIHRAIKTPGPWVWALARVRVGPERDLAAAQALQDALELSAKTLPASPAPAPPLDAAWGDYFYAVQKLIEENPPAGDEALFFRRIAALQLGLYDGFEKARFADVDMAAIDGGVSEARRLLRWAPGAAESGWIYPAADLADFGMDYPYRARMTLAFPGALPPAEALTLRAVAPGGGLSFSGAERYRLTLPGPPPADGFWSLTLYEEAPDGRLFLPDNPVNRGSIDGQTPLRRRSDGDIDIWIGHGDPGAAYAANWLQPSARGPFGLVFRAYQPGAALVDRRYRLRPVEATTRSG